MSYSLHPYTSMSSYHLFHSLSHIYFTSSSPTLSPLLLHLLYLFISHGFSPITSSSPQLIALLISYLNSPLPTTPTISDAAFKIFFCPLCFCGVLCMKDTIFSPFFSLIGFWNFVVYVITWFVVLFFLLDLWVLNLRL